ncbi:MAG: ABC transporter ATP-binding protein [Actinomycetota bacterium]|nr:ABC transporter ATP-binding protein [Actinomycetota bacterium]
MTAVLEAHDLAVEYRTRKAPVRALDGVSLAVRPGEVVGVVGESGSGKSTLGAALVGAMDAAARVVAGESFLDGEPVSEMSEDELRQLRRDRLGAVFQDPIGTLDPTARIGRQMGWALDRRLSDEEGRALLAEVRLPDPAAALRAYPHQLSGGMAQRVSIALALAREPAAVIADEPTASLDASIRVEILELLVSRARERGTSVLIITHDLPAVRRFCDRVAVMYGGRIVEEARAEVLFRAPAHPYTRALLGSALGREKPGELVEPIQGQPPTLHGACPGCAFATRCPSAFEACTSIRPEHHRVGDAAVLCHLYAPAPIAAGSGHESDRGEQ